MKSRSMLLFSILFILASICLAADKRTERRGEEADRFDKWLNEDVVYIISPEEKDVFKKLTTAEEKEKFIEQFWLRRDPTPGTIENEFKEEHYRRIAYANERFASGLPGWKTDRGRIYIMFGPPTEIESHPSGGSYQRPYWEGGGTTSTYPFEIWRYRYIDGVGQDVEIEFVDKTMSGEYRMALSPEEKDALLFVPNAGLTDAEAMGLASKADRHYFRPTANPDTSRQLYAMRAKDAPFERLAQYVNLQRPPQIKFKDLQSVVTAKITYNQLPFHLRSDLIRLNEEQFLVPITMEINNRDLQYNKEFDFYRGTVNVYGIVTSISGRIEGEFEEEIASEYREADYEAARNNKSVYQKLVALRPGLYKLEMVVKDVNSGKIGTLQTRIQVPRFPEDALATSSLILAARIEPIKNLLAAQRERFVIGDYKVIPNVRGEYQKGSDLHLYLHVYNAGVDQANLEPSLKVTYEILRDGRPVKTIEDNDGSSIGFFSGQRVILMRSLSLADLPEGEYRVRVKVQDHITGKSISSEGKFSII